MRERDFGLYCLHWSKILDFMAQALLKVLLALGLAAF